MNAYTDFKSNPNKIPGPDFIEQQINAAGVCLIGPLVMLFALILALVGHAPWYIVLLSIPSGWLVGFILLWLMVILNQ